MDVYYFCFSVFVFHLNRKRKKTEYCVNIYATLVMYFEFIAEFHTDEVDTNHVFIKLSGENKGQPLEYTDVVALVQRLRKKTGIYFTPHMLRHSSLTELRKAGWRDEHLMNRAGHAHIQTTMQMYIHPSDEDIRKDWENAQERMKINKENKGNNK